MLTDQLHRQYGDDAPLACALGLMAHDPSDPLRAGYSRENAAIAAAEFFGLADHDDLLAALTYRLDPLTSDESRDDIAAMLALNLLKSEHANLRA